MTIALDHEDLQLAQLEAQGLTPVRAPAGANGLLKRVFDILVAMIVFVFTLPLLFLIALAVKAQDRGPVIYRHTRIGRNGQFFTCYKFRTMKLDAPETLRELLQSDPVAAAEWQEHQKLRHDPRITWFGRFLRRSSLDELPQLLNIMRGEMSVVGPRPVTQQEIARYGADVKYYMAVRPGVTGLWQVSGRNQLSYDQRVALDTAYVRDWTYLLEAKILIRTLPAVLFSRGAF